jgi:hypothetical protein
MAIMVDQSVAGVQQSQRGQLRTQATRWMRTGMGAAGNKWANWGLAGVRESFTEGAASGLGFYKTPSGAPFGGMGPMQPSRYKFMGGVTKRSILGLGVGAGVGAAVYAATDNPLLGLGAGVGATWAAKASARGAFGAGMKLLGPAFIGAGMVQGFQEGGLWGGIKGLGGGLAEWGLWSVGFKALSVAFGGAMGGIKAMALTVALPLSIVAGAGYGAYKGAQYFAGRGRQAMRTEFAGDTAAFQTGAAYSMRQRAMQEISRSHTNSRTILGNEAQLMHLR